LKIKVKTKKLKEDNFYSDDSARDPNIIESINDLKIDLLNEIEERVFDKENAQIVVDDMESEIKDELVKGANEDK